MVELWREKLAVTSQKVAQSLADPSEYENLFPQLKEALAAEEVLRRERSELQPANAYPRVTVRVMRHNPRCPSVEVVLICGVYT